jgi:competence protein ComEA
MSHVRTLLPVLIAALLLLVPAPAPAGAAKSGPEPSGRELSASTTVGAEAGPKVNINTAGVKELMTLGGIGRKVAEKIIEYRQAHGPFQRAEDVRKVEGIGRGLWQRNRDRMVVD